MRFILKIKQYSISTVLILLTSISLVFPEYITFYVRDALKLTSVFFDGPENLAPVFMIILFLPAFIIIDYLVTIVIYIILDVSKKRPAKHFSLKFKGYVLLYSIFFIISIVYSCFNTYYDFIKLLLLNVLDFTFLFLSLIIYFKSKVFIYKLSFDKVSINLKYGIVLYTAYYVFYFINSLWSMIFFSV